MLFPYSHFDGVSTAGPEEPPFVGNVDPSLSAAKQTRPDAAPRRVLLVEDDPLASHAIVLLLRRVGFEAAAAVTVSEALSFLAAGSYEFVILDLMLPDGEGTEVLATIRARQLPTKVIVATASGDDLLLDRVRHLRPERILRKPTDIRTILSAMGLD